MKFKYFKSYNSERFALRTECLHILICRAESKGIAIPTFVSYSYNMCASKHTTMVQINSVSTLIYNSRCAILRAWRLRKIDAGHLRSTRMTHVKIISMVFHADAENDMVKISQNMQVMAVQFRSR